ncbi:MAG: cortex morphogenetic protein CmpA [Bacilli bacterium]
MPQWLRNQLTRAFYGKDRRQIRLLNECWFLFNQKDKA